MKYKTIIIVVLVLVVVTGFFLLQMRQADKMRIAEPTPAAATPQVQERVAQVKDDALSFLNESIHQTGLHPDGIPPLEQPDYMTASEADAFLEDWDQVFVYEGKNETYIYPQRIMVWHEIVNEEIDGEHIAITYCPLTASAVGYVGQDGNTYGTSGNLLNSNLVMYDRQTGSNIPQILGVGVNKGLTGVVLETRPVLWADWTDAFAKYPKAKVLSPETTFTRDYSRDPYGSYNPVVTTTYYQTGEPMFDLLNENISDTEDKKVVVGVKYGSNQVAIDPELVEAENVINFMVGKQPAVAFYDTALKTVRVFCAQGQGKALAFSHKDMGVIDQDGKVWYTNGTSEDGQQLDPITYFDVFWFAWQAYYPQSHLID